MAQQQRCEGLTTDGRPCRSILRQPLRIHGQFCRWHREQGKTLDLTWGVLLDLLNQRLLDVLSPPLAARMTEQWGNDCRTWEQAVWVIREQPQPYLRVVGSDE